MFFSGAGDFCEERTASRQVVSEPTSPITTSPIMARHIFPNTLSPLLVQLTLAMAFAVLLESGLSFLGIGAQPPEASLGSMLTVARRFLRPAPWYGVFPGLALVVLLLGLNFLSDAARTALDPRRANA